MTKGARSRAKSVPRYGRWSREFQVESGVDRVEFVGPSGRPETRSAFRHQPARFAYDRHGYEAIEAVGEPVTAVRFTPTEVGEHRYRALRGDTAEEEGAFACTPSGHPGYVRVSERDPRYFAFSDGSPYCPIGPDLCWPVRYALPQGDEHFATSGQRATLGLGDYRRWFLRLAENGGNYARL